MRGRYESYVNRTLADQAYADAVQLRANGVSREEAVSRLILAYPAVPAAMVIYSIDRAYNGGENAEGHHD